MFRFEKEMIPVLTKKLSEKYQTEFCINEFDSGNGIADLVFALGIHSRPKNDFILNYQLIYLILKYFNRKNKIVQIEKIFENTSFSKKEISKLTEILIGLGIVESIDKYKFIVKNKYHPPVRKIISIEAKLHDWKGGLYQALRYKTYSHKSYLAISEEFIHRVNIELLKEHNIGLISVSPRAVRFVLDVKNEKPNSKIAHAYLAQKIAYSCN